MIVVVSTPEKDPTIDVDLGSDEVKYEADLIALFWMARDVAQTSKKVARLTKPQRDVLERICADLSKLVGGTV